MICFSLEKVESNHIEFYFNWKYQENKSTPKESGVYYHKDYIVPETCYDFLMFCSIWGKKYAPFKKLQ